MTKISDYVKVEELKTLLLRRLVEIGLGDRIENLPENKINELIEVLCLIKNKIEDRSDTEKIEFLLTYCLSLVVILIKDYDFNTGLL